ncbi:hypothetical protein KIL84_006854 [Mauremys mutica]|uniref:Uncharacterized protein n=1 Tax=Mauremys mutica TaxID=74926 RepID=A0A9D3X1P6_9SAUR|nr:hypothetical protein KIL84_006854 [Mauremys mutica]
MYLPPIFCTVFFISVPFQIIPSYYPSCNFILIPNLHHPSYSHPIATPPSSTHRNKANGKDCNLKKIHMNISIWDTSSDCSRLSRSNFPIYWKMEEHPYHHDPILAKSHNNKKTKTKNTHPSTPNLTTNLTQNMSFKKSQWFNI